MFKPTPTLFRRIRRLALTTKQVNGGYYKGNRTGSVGRHTKYGGYVIEWNKVRTYVVPPNLHDFQVVDLIQSLSMAKLIDRDIVDPVRHSKDETDKRQVRRGSKGRFEWGAISGTMEN